MARRSVLFDKIATWFSPYFRSRRKRLFVAALSPDRDTTILDVGGEPLHAHWHLVPGRITTVNVYKPAHCGNEAGYELVIGDGTNLPFVDKSFDIAYSNSVIEHLRTFEDQRRFADSILRVGRQVWVQTPARSFPIELHLKSPLIHYFPRRIQRKLIRNFTVWGWLTRPSQAEVDALLDEVRLLSYREMKALFPGCRILKEKFLLLTKSYIAVSQRERT